ncbi:MAG: TonB-dependent receptor [Gammaproteobacteria bacterium]|nr:TonB-dependent receptor [Gammaproteobacteria bacterium]
MNKSYSVALPLLAGFATTLPAVAADLDEIVVYADYRDTPLMRQAGSISVVDPQALEVRQSRHLDELLGTLPNVSMSSGGSRARFLQIRGVGDLEQFVDPKHYPSVGITIDDIPLNGLAGAALLLDVKQLELLRGPQGTRFGANALGGMVNITTNDPGEAFEADLDAGYASYNTWFVSGAAGGMLSATSGLRIAARIAQSDGWMKNSALNRDDTAGRDERVIRGKYLWQASDDLSVTFSAAYADIDNGYDAFTFDNTRTSLADQPGRDAQELAVFGASMNFQMSDALTLQLVASYADNDETYSYDEDWVYAGFCDGVRCDPLMEFVGFDQINRDRSQWTVDARLLGSTASVDWVLGVYAQAREENLVRNHFGVFSSDWSNDRQAVYGQLRLPLGELALTAGARVEHYGDDYADSNGLLDDSGDTFVSGELTLSYQATDNTMWYATLARGVKPGGVNTEASSVAPFMGPDFQAFLANRLLFGKESLWNKEVGVKTRLLDNRLTARAALFHMSRNNAQLESWLWDVNNFIWVGLLDSVGGSDNYGAEIELQWALTDRVSWFANLGWLETNINSITTFDLDLNDFIVKQDRDQAKAPHWQYQTGVDVEFAPALSAHLEVEGRSGSYYGYYHDGRLSGYTLVNGSMTYRRDQWRVVLWARNLLDEDYAVHGLYFANDPRDGFAVNHNYRQFGEPRTYGVTLGYSF